MWICSCICVVPNSFAYTVVSCSSQFPRWCRITSRFFQSQAWQNYFGHPARMLCFFKKTWAHDAGQKSEVTEVVRFQTPGIRRREWSENEILERRAAWKLQKTQHAPFCKMCCSKSSAHVGAPLRFAQLLHEDDHEWDTALQICPLWFGQIRPFETKRVESVGCFHGERVPGKCTNGFFTVPPLVEGRCRSTLYTLISKSKVASFPDRFFDGCQSFKHMLWSYGLYPVLASKAIPQFHWRQGVLALVPCRWWWGLSSDCRVAPV